MSRSKLLQQFYQDVWVRNDLDAIDRYFSPTAHADGLIPRMLFTPQDFRELVMSMTHLFGKIEVDCPVVVENGDWVAALVRARTSRADTGAPIEVTGQTMVRFEGDRMVEAYNHFDYVSLFEQLGQFPCDTVPVCMTGQRLGWS
jgi:hypothetical protein